MFEQATEKYEQGKEFIDPLLRCKDCQGLVHREFISQYGCCQKCGNRRFSNVRLLQEEEMAGLKDGTYNLEVEYTIDPLWFELFKGGE